MTRGAPAANQKDANQRRKIRTRSQAGDAEETITDLCKRKEETADRKQPGSQRKTREAMPVWEI